MSVRTAIRMQDVGIEFSFGRHVGKRGFQALHGVSLCLNHGEKLGIVGRNGAGKSTLLRLIADVLQPDTGTVFRDHGRCQLLALGVGFIGHLSGRQNAYLSGLLMGIDKRDMKRRLEDVKEFSELGEFFDQPLDTYSSGMRSRLAFSTGIQLEPDILLLDEVLSVGDASFKRKSREVIRGRLDSNATIVMVSHDERILSEICDRIIWLEAGRSIEDGPPEQVLPRYSAALTRKRGRSANDLSELEA